MSTIYSKCALIALAVVLAFSPAFAAVSGTAKAQIPFAFKAGEAEMQPGVYHVERVSGSPVFLLTSDAGKKIAVMTSPVSKTSLGSEGMLSFVRQGDRYVLAQIWLAGYDRANALPASGAPAYQVAMVRP